MEPSNEYDLYATVLVVLLHVSGHLKGREVACQLTPIWLCP